MSQDKRSEWERKRERERKGMCDVTSSASILFCREEAGKRKVYTHTPIERERFLRKKLCGQPAYAIFSAEPNALLSGTE